MWLKSNNTQHTLPRHSFYEHNLTENTDFNSREFILEFIFLLHSTKQQGLQESPNVKSVSDV